MSKRKASQELQRVKGVVGVGVAEDAVNSQLRMLIPGGLWRPKDEQAVLQGGSSLKTGSSKGGSTYQTKSGRLVQPSSSRNANEEEESSLSPTKLPRKTMATNVKTKRSTKASFQPSITKEAAVDEESGFSSSTPLPQKTLASSSIIKTKGAMKALQSTSMSPAVTALLQSSDFQVSPISDRGASEDEQDSRKLRSSSQSSPLGDSPLVPFGKLAAKKSIPKQGAPLVDTPIARPSTSKHSTVSSAEKSSVNEEAPTTSEQLLRNFNLSQCELITHLFGLVSDLTERLDASNAVITRIRTEQAEQSKRLVLLEEELGELRKESQERVLLDELDEEEEDFNN